MGYILVGFGIAVFVLFLLMLGMVIGWSLAKGAK